MKPEVYRVAERYSLPVTLVADQWMRIPEDGRVTLIVVERNFDAADDRIAELAGPDAIVVTSDIPLASRAIERGAAALSPTGRVFTEDNIGDTLATRNLLADLRGAGEQTAGPPPFGPRDRSAFLQSLDTLVHAVKRKLEGR